MLGTGHRPGPTRPRSDRTLLVENDMNQPNLCLRIPLSAKPALQQIAAGLHGRIPVERCRLDGLWSLHLYLSPGELHVNRAVLPIRPGYVSVMPPGTELEYRFPRRSRNLYAHFALPAAEDDTMPL